MALEDLFYDERDIFVYHKHSRMLNTPSGKALSPWRRVLIPIQVGKETRALILRLCGQVECSI
jgi:hypothetical protein